MTNRQYILVFTISNQALFLENMMHHCQSSIPAFLCLVAQLALTAPSAGQAVSAKEVFKKAGPAVMVIIALDDNNQPLSLGSGFYTRSDLVATNLHVVRKAKKLRVFGAIDQKERKVKGIHAVSSDHDIAVLTMKDAGEPLPCATAQLETGDPVLAIGNPRGLEATLSTGIVSGIRKQDKTSLFQITAPISPGSSGGPVLNDKAQVVGVATSYIDAGQNLNFAVHVKHLLEAVASNSTGTIQEIDVLGKSDAVPLDKRTTAIESVKLTAPEFDGGSDYSTQPWTHQITWQLSFKNDGDKPVKNIDLLILISDKKTGDMIHFVRQKVVLNIPPKLAKRTTLKEGGLYFQTVLAKFSWNCEYRILSFEYDE